MNEDSFASKQRLFNRMDLRFLILRALRNQPGYMANQEVLLLTLREQGHAISRDQLHVELSWLDQVANVVIDRVTGNMHIATLTLEGLDAAEGTRFIPGIRRPLPDESP
jgi:hypothetical protein